MVKCQICSKVFKNKQALGGHIVNAHPKGNEEAFPGGIPESKGGETRDKAELIRELIEQGYSLEQIVNRFGFNYQTVWQEMKKQVKPQNTLDKKELLPAKIDDRRQQIVPEYLLKMLASLDESRALTPLETILLFQAARRTVVEDVNILQGLVEAQAKTMETQLKVLREAKSESSEVAIKAAEEVAARVAAYFDQKKPDIASAPNPFEGLFARLMETTLTNLMNKLFPGSGSQTLPGFIIEKRRKGD